MTGRRTRVPISGRVTFDLGSGPATLQGFWTLDPSRAKTASRPRPIGDSGGDARWAERSRIEGSEFARRAAPGILGPR